MKGFSNLVLLELLKVAVKQNCFPHALHVYAFCSLFVPCCSTKHKMSLNTGTYILQGWAFLGDKTSLRFLICDIPSANMPYSEGVSSSSFPCQETRPGPSARPPPSAPPAGADRPQPSDRAGRGTETPRRRRCPDPQARPGRCAQSLLLLLRSPTPRSQRRTD
uniref:Uncharacterized protein n=1 Tax=Sus scrofa TaxID=9823 RepID=A0A480FUC6_PIG